MENNDKFRSIYYSFDTFEPLKKLEKSTTALLVIDLQNAYKKLGRNTDDRNDKLFSDFAKRLDDVVLPNVKTLEDTFRENGIKVIFCRIACHLKDGSDRSLSQKKPGWNNVLLPYDEYDSQIIDEVKPQGDEIVVKKTTDSALTG
ncbi:MAG: cysteine hydrolase family protein, partial [Succinivibrio sp.]